MCLNRRKYLIIAFIVKNFFINVANFKDTINHLSIIIYSIIAYLYNYIVRIQLLLLNKKIMSLQPDMFF